ncbi:MAG: pilus assembly protein [Lachnospiraceae bacterium]|nr:pilus assembly protein [Lachnospiraceae bacterium]
MHKRRWHGSVSLEAALVMPFFLYFMMNLLTLFDALRIQTALEAALHQTGREIGAYAFDLMYAADTASELAGAGGVNDLPFAVDVGSNVLSAAYAQTRIRDFLDVLAPNTRCVEGGADALSFLRSGFTSDSDIIDLAVSCRIRPFISIMGFDAFPVEARYYAHAWTGYGIGQAGEPDRTKDTEETVYMTPGGAVYHTSAECTYLRPAVHSTSSDALSALRNESGAIYYPCEYCGGGDGTVYLTPYGDRYHASASCSRLMRTIEAVPLSEAAGRRPCSKCGQSH